MYGFKNFLIEQLRSNSMIPDSGFNDVSEINHDGERRKLKMENLLLAS